MPSLVDIFPEPRDFFALAPEELGAVLMEVIPSVEQHAGFGFGQLVDQLYPHPASGRAAYPPNTRNDALNVIAEAVAWLQTQGLVVRNPGQPAEWYMRTRRGRTMRQRSDLESYRLARTLPLALLQQRLADKVFPLYMRGEYDTAVFQAFREVELAVREAGSFPNDLVGKGLMSKAFNATNGALRNQALTKDEREAEALLFIGAVGHGRNPPGHRDVNHSRETAARLIVFASHLLDLIEQRSPQP